ncbi:MAG: hypothetical protein ACJA0M_002364, partial [Chitinophagales bacterium]
TYSSLSGSVAVTYFFRLVSRQFAQGTEEFPQLFEWMVHSDPAAIRRCALNRNR